MKFLLALSVLATTSAFAHNGISGDKIKCYESSQDGHRKPAYVFEEKGRYGGGLNREIKLVYPDYHQLEEKHGCLVSKRNGEPTTEESRNSFKACLGEGQEIGRLIPVEIEHESENEDYLGTVYCERDILDYLNGRNGQ
jgi:hypothetical protein